MPEWEPIYAELQNKIRWSISSTARSAGFNYSFQDSLALATWAAGDALKLMKVRDQKGDYLFNHKAIKNILTNGKG